jgi:hypothetical protein
MMMNKSYFIYLFLLFSISIAENEFLQPYILAGETGKSLNETISMIKKSFFMKDQIDIIGEYNPKLENKSHILILSNSNIDKAIELGNEFTAISSVFRLAVFKKGERTYISYQNPKYWGNLYFQNNYNSVKDYLNEFEKQLINSLPKMRRVFNQQYGSHQSFTEKNLQNYHYMFGMEYFDDNILLGEFKSFIEAISIIDNNLEDSKNCNKVFEKELPNKEIKLYGIELSGKKGENHFMPIIDKSKYSHISCLPYEIIVIKNKVYMLHGRFRIAASFPDLTMVTFGKIMSTPSDIENQLKKLMK